MSLKKKTIKNVGIVYAMTIFIKLLSLAGFIILARLLLPIDFGLVALSAVIIGFLTLFKDFGFSAALIQRSNHIEEAANVTFWGNIIMRGMLYLVAFTIAPVVASFFNEPLVEPIMRVAALSFVIESLGATHSSLLMKELQFSKIAIVNIVDAIVATASTIVLALLGFSFWSLVYGSLICEPVGAALLWKLSSWRPKWTLDRKVAREMLGFSSYIVIINMLYFLTRNIDNFIIGKVLGAAFLGIYTIAYRFGLYSATNISILVSNVMFPTYSKLQLEEERIRKAYLKTFSLIALIAIPVALGTMAVAQEFVFFLLGKNWEASIVPLQILCIYGLFLSLAVPSANVLLAVGKPKISSLITVTQLLIILVLIYPSAISMGLVGVSLAVTLAIVVGSMLYIFFTCKVLSTKLNSVLRTLLEPLVASMLMFVSILLVKSVVVPSFFGLLIYITTGVVVYVLSISFLTRGALWVEVRDIFGALIARE